MKLNVRSLLNESLPFLLALMTFMTILVSARTLDEMRRQREDANRPELYANDIGVFIIEVDSTIWFKPTGVDSVPWSEPSNPEVLCENDLLEKVQALSDSLVFEFVNVGRGPAIDIQADWIYSDSAIEAFWESSIGDTAYRHWHLEEAMKTQWRWWSNGANCGLAQHWHYAGQESGFLLPADMKPQVLEVDFWEEMIFVHLSTIHQGMRKNQHLAYFGFATQMESAHTLNIDYKTIEQTLFRQQFEVTIRTNHAWANASTKRSSARKPVFRVEVSIDPVGKEEVAGYSKDERPRMGGIVWVNPTEEKLASPPELVPADP